MDESLWVPAPGEAKGTFALLQDSVGSTVVDVMGGEHRDPGPGTTMLGVVEEWRAEVASLTDRNRRLEHLVRELRRLLYGKKSEKLHPDQLQLAFEALEGAVAELEPAPPASATPGSRRKRRVPERNLGHLPEHLPRVEQVIEPRSTHCPK